MINSATVSITRQEISLWTTRAVVLLSAWACLWSLWPNRFGVTAATGDLSQVLLIFGLAFTGFTLIFNFLQGSPLRLPPLLGALLAGLLHSSIIAPIINHEISSILRSMALVLILISAGLNLNMDVVRSSVWWVLCLGVVPMLAEAATISALSVYLFSWTWAWGGCLGFVLCTLSPAVVVPEMIRLLEIPGIESCDLFTILIAAGSIENALGVTGMSIAIGFVFQGSDSSTGFWEVMKCPLQIVAGLAIGVVGGVILWFIPYVSHITPFSIHLPQLHTLEGTKGPNEVHHRSGQSCGWFTASSPRFSSSTIKTFLLFLFGSFSVFASKQVNWSGSGPIGTLTLAVFTVYGWNRSGLNIDAKDLQKIKQTCKLVWWLIGEILLFGLIGAEVSLAGNTVLNTEWSSILIIFAVGISARLLTVFTVMSLPAIIIAPARRLLSRSGYDTISDSAVGESPSPVKVWSWREIFFTSLVSIPKATVQAAIGGAVLDEAIKRGFQPEDVARGQMILTSAVLSILVFGPIGAIAIRVSSEKLFLRRI